MPADVLWALAHRRPDNKVGRQVRLDLHLDVVRFLPIQAQVDGMERGSESAAFIGTLEPGLIYLADRNFVDFQFLGAVPALGSDFVVRLKKEGSGPNLCVLKENPLAPEDTDAGVLLDQIARLPGSQGTPGFGEKAFRVVSVWVPVASRKSAC